MLQLLDEEVYFKTRGDNAKRVAEVIERARRAKGEPT
jgi:hypothetical protein